MRMGRRTAQPALITVATALLFMAGCGGSSGHAGGKSEGKAQEGYAPSIDPADFSTKIDNKYFPLKPGTTFVYEGKTADATEGDTVEVTSDIRTIMGVERVVVDDRVT